MAIDVLRWLNHAAIRIESCLAVNTSPYFPFLLTEDVLPGEALNTSGDNAQSDGGDIRFSTDPYGRIQIACEIVVWTQDATPANRKAEIWVKLPAWFADTHQFIYMWWNTSITDTQPPLESDYGKDGVWNMAREYDPMNKLIYHCQEASGNLLESTRGAFNLNRLFDTGSAGPSQVDGYIQKGQEFDRSGQQYFQSSANIGTDLAGSNARYISCWVYLDDTNRSSFVNWGNNVSGQRFGIGIRNGNWYFWGYGGGNDWDTGVSPSTGTWYHVLLWYDGNVTIRLWINNSEIGSGHTLPSALNTGNTNLWIGKEIDGATISYFDGIIDEVRVYVALSTNRKTNLYAVQVDPTVYAQFMNGRLSSDLNWGEELNAGGWQRQARITLDVHTGAFDAIEVPIVLLEDCVPAEILDSGHPTTAYGIGDIRLTLDRHGLYPLPVDIRTFIQSATPATRKLQLWTKFPQWRMDFKNELWIWWRKSGADQPSPLLDSGAYRAYDDTWRSVLTMVDGANPIDDETMYNNAATGFGNLPNFTTGKIYRAQDLNGSTDYMIISPDRTLSPRTGAFTISCWIYPHSVTGAVRQIFSEKGGSGEPELEINSSGKLEIYISGLELTSNATLSANTWYHIVVIRDTGNTLRLYINGVQDNSVGSITDDIQINSDFYIGRDATGTQYYDGLIDQFMFNVGRAFTAYEVKAMYENQNGPSNLMTPGEGMDVDLFWGYEYEQEFAIPASQIDADIDNMPVLFTEANLPAGIFGATTEQRCRADGGDLAFGSTDGKTRYPCEIAYFDTGADKAEIWVRVPNLDDTTGKNLKVYWKKPGQTQPPVDNWYGKWRTWDRFYVAVFHTNEPTLKATQFIDYFMEEKLNPFFTAPEGAGDILADFGDPVDGQLQGAANGTDTQFFDAIYDGDWTIEVHGVRNGANYHGVKMEGDGGTTIEARANGTNLIAAMTGQSTDTDPDPFGGTKIWLRIVYNATAQTLTFYYATFSADIDPGNPTSWTQYHQYTSINLGTEKFYPAFDNSGGNWRYVKVTGDNPDYIADSTRHNRHHYALGDLNDQIDGKVWKGQDLDGTGDYWNHEINLPINGSNLTLDLWSKKTASNSGYILSQGAQSAARRRLHFGHRDADTFTLAFWSDDLDYDHLQDTGWEHWTGRFIRSTGEQRIYRNGASVANRTANTEGLKTYEGHNVGRRSDGSLYFTGQIDEIRIASINRSAAFINACYLTQNAPNTFAPVTGSIVKRLIIGKVMFQGTLKHVDFRAVSNRVSTGLGTDVTKVFNKGSQLGDFQKLLTANPLDEDWRGYRAIRFNGDADLMKSSFSVPSDILGNNNWSIEAWIRLETNPPSNGENPVVQTGKRNTALENCQLGAGFNEWGAAVLGTGYDLAYNPLDKLLRMADIDNRDFVHLVLTFNTLEDTVWIFVNGEENRLLDVPGLNLVAQVTGIIIGGAATTAGTGQAVNFEGDIAAVRIYNGHMSIGDIQNNFHYGLRGQSESKNLINGSMVNPKLVNGGLI